MEPLQKFILEHNTMTLATVGNKVASAAAVFYLPIKNNTSLIFLRTILFHVKTPNSGVISKSCNFIKKCGDINH